MILRKIQELMKMRKETKRFTNFSRAKNYTYQRTGIAKSKAILWVLRKMPSGCKRKIVFIRIIFNTGK